MTDFASEREAMVERQFKRRGIREPEILDAFRAVPREAFVGASLAHLAYGDHPLPIEAGQTISQPYIVALMIQAAAIKAGRHGARGRGRVGLCGGGDRPHRGARDRHRAPARFGRGRARAAARLGYDNVEIVEGDGTRAGRRARRTTRSSPPRAEAMCPQPLIEQLAPGAGWSCRSAIPAGRSGWSRSPRSGRQLVSENLGAVRFVPLIGEEGWKSCTNPRRNCCQTEWRAARSERPCG